MLRAEEKEERPSNGRSVVANNSVFRHKRYATNYLHVHTLFLHSEVNPKLLIRDHLVVKGKIPGVVSR
jgi:hypothetical protein